MSAIKLFTPHQSDGLFGELYISTDYRTGVTRIGIYDSGYECLNVDELVAVRAHLNSIILKLKFPKSEKDLPF